MQSDRGNSSAFSSSRGATFIEFAIGIPVALVAIFSIFYFCFFLYVRGLANTAANRGLSVASVEPGLDAEGNITTPVGNAEAAARAFLASTVVGSGGNGGLARIVDVKLVLPENTDPVLNPNPPPQSANRALSLQAYPMQMVVTVQMNPIVPFFPAPTFEVRAVGYREPRFNSSLPAAVDCLGRLVGPSPPYVPPTSAQCTNIGICLGKGVTAIPVCDAATQTPNAEECRCDCKNPLHVNLGSRCACAPPSPACVLPQVQSDASCLCACPPPSPACVGSQVQNQISCLCGCSTTCSSPKSRQDAVTCNCSCPTSCNTSNHQRQEDDCTCSCIDPFKWDDSHTSCVCSTTCTAPKSIQDPNTCVCSCPNISTVNAGVCANAATNGGFYDSANCKCSCPTGKTWDESTKKCVCNTTCTGQGQIQNPDCSCACPSCPQNQEPDPNSTSCGCRCKPGFTPGLNSTCVCATACAAPYNNQNPNTCQCSCLACTGGRIPDLSNLCGCICPDGKPWDPVSQSCKCSAQCSSPKNEQWGDCSCRCPNESTLQPACEAANSGGVFDASTCECKCPDGRPWNALLKRCTCGNICSAPKSLRDAGTCECSCPNTATVNQTTCNASGATYNAATCACDCPSGRTWNGTACVCSKVCNTAPFTKLDSQACACTCGDCPNSAMLPDPSNQCACSCPGTCSSPKSFDAACNCLCPACPPNYERADSNTCTCRLKIGN